MRSSIDILNYVDKLLRGKVLPKQYKGVAPDNENGEYIVVDILVSVGNQEQNTTINVNTYVPNISLESNGVVSKSQPNFIRINELSKQVIAILNDNWKDNNYVTITSQDIFYEKESTFFMVQLNFKNFNYGN